LRKNIGTFSSHYQQENDKHKIGFVLFRFDKDSEDIQVYQDRVGAVSIRGRRLEKV
jgi:hypothetical protein